jgi:U5 small nuclear ribonucleoprotein component
MDDNLYDEFGNYIGPEIESDRESDGEEEDEELPDKPHEDEEESDGEDAVHASNGWLAASDDVDMDNQVVLAEDKKYYPTVEEVYGPGVETLVNDEDEQPLEQPIIKPVRCWEFPTGDVLIIAQTEGKAH